MTVQKQQVVDTRPCPHCNAHPGQHCWSTFHSREMVEEVHHERYPPARWTTK